MTEQAAQAFSLSTGLVKPFAIPALGAIAGVFLKDRYDSSKAKKQYGVTDAEFLCEQIDTVRELALNYWSSSPTEKSPVEEARVTGMLHGCAEIISSTNLGNKEGQETLQDALSDFRKVCASGSFGQVAREIDLHRLSEIEIEGRVLAANILSFRRQ
ncbi:MAG: hypothetical protein ACI8Q6_002903 [Granulosicoccus sp.]